MTDKDPKDMTASELLRLAASEGKQGGWTGTVRKLAYLVGISDLRICELNTCDLLDESYKIVADKIDAELADARAEGISEGFNSSLRVGSELWAKSNGWPDFKEGEDIGQWLDRCAFPKPMDEHGEPVQLGEHIDDKVRGEVEVTRISYTANGHYFNNYHNSVGTRIAKRITYAPGERVKRPAPEVLGADGLPIKADETVYMAGSLADTPNDKAAETVWAHGGPLLVLCESDRAGYLICMNNMGVKLDVRPEDLTHTHPETQERIDGDKGKSGTEYWGCIGFLCGDCPAEIDGKRPSDRYGVLNCSIAQGMDIARRQRELDKRTGGE